MVISHVSWKYPAQNQVRTFDMEQLMRFSLILKSKLASFGWRAANF
jgi:hypothetical protein